MEELKQKYGIDDKAIFEIADSLEPEAETPEIPPMGKERTTTSAPGALPASLASAMRGDISIAEAIILLDFMDRKEDRRERRYGSTPSSQDTSNIKEILDEMREERRAHSEQIEKLILGKRADDAEDRAKRAEEGLKKKEETDRQREIVEGAVRGAVGEIDQKYGAQLDSLANVIHNLPAKQQTSFWDEMFTDFESGLKTQFKDSVMERFKPPEKSLTKTDDEGKKTFDWEALIERGYKLADKYIDTQKSPPPKLPVKEMPPLRTDTQVPLDEGPSKTTEGPPQDVPTTPPPSPIPPEDIAGIGPERAKKLSELGINDARQLAKVSPSYLKEQIGVSKEKADDIVKQAKDLTDKA